MGEWERAVSRRSVLESMGAISLSGLGATAETKSTASTTVESSVSVSDDSEYELAHAKRPVWVVQRKARAQYHDSYRSIRLRNLECYCTLAYLGARWSEPRGGTGHWVHEFVLTGIGLSWTDYPGSRLERKLTAEIDLQEIDVTAVSGAARIDPAATNSRWMILPSTLEDRIETDVGRQQVTAALSAGERQPGNVDWDGLSGAITQQSTNEIVYELPEDDDDRLVRPLLAAGIPLESVSTALVPVVPDRTSAYIQYNPPASFIQAHYNQFEVVVSPGESGSIEVVSEFGMTDDRLLDALSPDYRARNTLDVDIQSLPVPHEAAVHGWGREIRMGGAPKPPTRNDESCGTVLDSLTGGYMPPDSPQHGATYAVDQEIPFDDPSTDEAQIIDSGWWGHTDGTGVLWGKLTSDSFSVPTDGTNEFVHVQKRSDGLTKLYPRTFETEDTSADSGTTDRADE